MAILSSNSSARRFAAAVVAFAAFSSISSRTHAQGVPCTVSTNTTRAYLSMGSPRADWTQQGSDWTFRRTSSTGPLLAGIGPFWGPYGAWGSPLFDFNVPLVGPVYSPTPALNQNPNYSALPTFTGLMIHPGYTLDTFVVYTARSSASFISGRLLIENLGGSNTDGANVRILIERISGAPSSTLVPTTFVPRRVNTNPVVPINFSGGSVTLAIGDRIIMQVNRGGTPYEDWVNADLTLNLDSSAPIIEARTGLSGPISGCIGVPLSLSISAIGANIIRWRKDGIPLSDDGRITGSSTATLSIASFNAGDIGQYDVRLTGDCASSTSDPFIVSACLGEYNCDGGVDGADVDAFFADWSLGLEKADLNGDGGIDGGDVDVFFERWSAGC